MNRSVRFSHRGRPLAGLLSFLMLTGCAVLNLEAVTEAIYFIDANSQQIRSVDTNGANNQLLVQLATGTFNGINGGANAQQISVDAQYGLFWTDLWHDRIRHANLDGSSLSDVILTGNGEDIQIDPVAGKIYWTEWPDGGSGTFRTLRRANTDGSSPEIVIDNTVNAGPSLFSASAFGPDFAVDFISQKIYYLDSNGIHRINYDGTGDSLFLATPSGGIGVMKVDSYSHRLFYSPSASGPPAIDPIPSVEQVYQVSLLNPSAPQLIYDYNVGFDNRMVFGIGLDYHRSRAYMVDQFDFKLGSVQYDGTSSFAPGAFIGLKAFDLLAVPEPSTALLAVVGGVCFLRRRGFPTAST